MAWHTRKRNGNPFAVNSTPSTEPSIVFLAVLDPPPHRRESHEEFLTRHKNARFTERAADTGAFLCLMLSAWTGSGFYFLLSLVMLGIAVHEMVGVLRDAADHYNRMAGPGYYARGVSAPVATWFGWAIVIFGLRFGFGIFSLLGFELPRLANRQLVMVNASLGTKLFKTW